MAKPTFTALKNVLEQADLILATAPALPENRTAACRELLQTALALTNDLRQEAATAAVAMGRKGGKMHCTSPTTTFAAFIAPSA